MGRLGSIASTAALAFGLACFAGSASAQSNICEHLESRLVALDSHPGSGSELGKYHEADRAVRRQMRELDQAIDEGRRAGCLGGFFAQFEKRGASCGRVTAGIKRMEANLDRLTEIRDRYSSDPLDDSGARDELVAALAENGCGAQYEANAPSSRRPGIFARFFGDPVSREPGGWGDPFFGDDYGTYRTLCVRTCDGYYFPISFSTTQSRFADDEATCQAQCPGTNVALYVHRSGEESGAMVSLAGEPYSALPTAFRYRQTYDKSCSCGKIAAPAAPMTPIPDNAAAAGPDPWGFARAGEPSEPSGGNPPVPLARPAAEDPETLANRAGSFRPGATAAPAAVADLKPGGERTVRIVGPSYYYGQ